MCENANYLGDGGDGGDRGDRGDRYLRPRYRYRLEDNWKIILKYRN